MTRLTKLFIIFLILPLIIFFLIQTPIKQTRAAGNTYYVDSVNGSDANPGTSEDQAWQTLEKVMEQDFQPGDVTHFKRGSSWTGGLVIDDSGVEGNPVFFTTYGTGDRPILRNPGSWTRAVNIEADWVVVEGLLVRDAHEAGIYITEGSDNNVIRNIEATDVGMGVSIHGQHNHITQSYIHDLHMVINTPGGNDDYGAIGVWFFNSYNEVSYNRVINCIVPSYDYGDGGGTIEFYGNADNNYIHHNWGENNDGFLEVGGGSSKNNVITYNVSLNNHRFSWIHLSGVFASEMENFRVENNTIIIEIASNHWVNFGFVGEPVASTFILRNNIVYQPNLQYVSNKSSFTHDHNLYYLIDGDLGFSLGEGEQIADPLFVGLAGEDFHLLPPSPAIDAGIDLGYILDFEDGPVPVGAAPDLGAFEYQDTPGDSNQ